MARVPGLGPVKSRLHAAIGPEMATLLYRCFLLDRLDGLAALPGIIPLVAFTPAHGRARLEALAPPGVRLIAQEGDGLGERLSRLLGGLLAEGHRGAIAMDSDSPTLPMAHVAEAAAVLDQAAADLVVGPTDDGGYYLVGLGRLEPSLFADIPWSTDRVLALTLERARAIGLRTHVLPAWYDVDTEADLARLARDLRQLPDGPRRTSRCVEVLGGWGETPAGSVTSDPR